MAENTNTERDYPPLPKPAYPSQWIGGGHGGEGSFTKDGYSVAQLRAYVDADRQARASLPLPAAGQEPMFWVRLCGDGLYEGPIHNARIEKVRRQSGVWSPLYLAAAPQPAVAAGWMPIETAPKGEKVLLAGRDRKPCIDDWALYCRINQPGFTHWMPLPPAPSTEGESNG